MKTYALNEQISAINKEISNLKVEIVTQDQFLLVAKDRVQLEAIN